MKELIKQYSKVSDKVKTFFAAQKKTEDAIKDTLDHVLLGLQYTRTVPLVIRETLNLVSIELYNIKNKKGYLQCNGIRVYSTSGSAMGGLVLLTNFSIHMNLSFHVQIENQVKEVLGVPSFVIGRISSDFWNCTTNTLSVLGVPFEEITVEGFDNEKTN